jgi:lipid II:glycine glycyltransferase (peptidoglycan interpeptide bridge formation enzyme)
VQPAELSALDTSGELLQSGFWGFFKEGHGWKAHPFRVTAGSSPDAFGLLVLTRRLFRALTLAYVPFGPAHDPVTGRGDFLAALSAALRPHLPHGTFLIRYDLPWRRQGESPGERQPASGAPRLRKAASDIQPPSTVIVDLAPPEEAVLAAMKPKTRYNVRLAAKRGVTVHEGTPGDVEGWYELYRETSRRDRIAIHARSYYADLLFPARPYTGAAPAVRLLLARHGADILAGNIVLFWRARAVYLTGASSNARRNLMPTYALQWEAMRRARAAGCTEYDLYGIPPRPEPDHPMFGLYQFKTGFSDGIVERWGTWDAPLSPALYLLYAAVEGARMAFFRGLRKRTVRRTRTSREPAAVDPAPQP